MSLVEDAYLEAIQAMSPCERLARVEAMLAWTRNLLARRIAAESPVEFGPKRLRWEVALRMYGSEPDMRRLLEENMPDVSS
jgi:hypothetical protein